MEKGRVKLWILHAGIGHVSPYFFNLSNELKKYKDYEVIVDANMPLDIKTKNGIVYFNRLKRYYDSDDIESINKFIDNVLTLKNNGWKLIFTLHNFFPIDRDFKDNDEYLLKKFLPLMDKVFTFSNSMKNSLKTHFNIDAIVHGIGKNTLFDNDSDIDLSFIKDNDFVFTFIGNISKYKMLDKVIDNFNKLNNKNILLLICGPNSRNYELNINNDKIIRINEFITEGMWAKICDKTNVIINSYDIDRESFKYGFYPSNCIQIIEHKKIAIAPNCEAIKELLPNGYYYPYEKGNLLDVMKLVIKDKKKIKELETTYPDISFSWEDVVKIIINEIRGLK